MVFLNDHYAPHTAKLNVICQKLLNEKKILKFLIIDDGSPKSKVKMLYGNEVTLDTDGCTALLRDK